MGHKYGVTTTVSIEYVHNNFCRKHLSVQKTTNTCMVLGECGRLPFSITYITNCISSNHKLGIEIGRHIKIPKEERFCAQCHNCIDCEFHAFFICKKYENIRENYLFNWYLGGRDVQIFLYIIVHE